MPTYHVEMLEGRTLAQREKLVEEITRVSVEVLGGSPASVDVLIVDVKAENWAHRRQAVESSRATSEPAAVRKRRLVLRCCMAPRTWPACAPRLPAPVLPPGPGNPAVYTDFMCQLLGMNSRLPASLTLSFTGFPQRGGCTDHHADGWGIAFLRAEGDQPGKAARHFVDKEQRCHLADCAHAAQLPDQKPQRRWPTCAKPPWAQYPGKLPPICARAVGPLLVFRPQR